MLFRTALGVGVLVAVHSPRSVFACPGFSCNGGEVFPRSGTLPARQFRLRWSRLSSLSTLEHDSVRVFRASDAPGGGMAATPPSPLRMQAPETLRDLVKNRASRGRSRRRSV